jgi:itaconyl-CoA hydratase
LLTRQDVTVFATLRPTAPRRFRENVGLAFEDFDVGQVFHHRPGITITQQDNVNEALATHNQAMIHYDREYASHTEFKLPLVVSTLTLQRAIGMTWKTFGRRKRIAGFRSIVLSAPVYGENTLYSRSNIVAKAAVDDPDCGLVTIETLLARQDKTDVAKIEWSALIYRSDRGPFEAWGY